MRVLFHIAISTLILVLASRPMHGQMHTPVSPLHSIQMIDSQIGWAATRVCGPCLPQMVSGLMLRTTNGGTEWNDVTPVDSSGQRGDVLYFYVLNSHFAWVEKPSTAAPSTEIFRTVDGGRVWKSVAIRTMEVTSISFINPRQGWLMAFDGAYAGSEAVSIYSSADGGETWIAVSSVPPFGKKDSLPFVGGKTSITFVNPTTGWVTVEDPRSNQPFLYVTRDGGYTWRPQSLPLPPEVKAPWGASPMLPKFLNSQEGIVSAFFTLRNDSGERTGGLAIFFATHDGGTTWTYIAPVPAGYNAVADMNHAWSLSAGVLRMTSNGGHQWVTLPPNPLFVDVNRLDFISPQVGWAIKQTHPFLLKTSDAGRTWAPLPYTILR